MTTAAHGEVHARLRNWVESWRHRHRSVRELARLDRDVVDEVAHDLGLGVAELNMLAGGHDGPSTLMPSRLEQLGLDVDGVRMCDPEVFRDLERVCAHCKSVRRCRRDLARKDVEAGMQDYCLNAATLDALVAGRKA